MSDRFKIGSVLAETKRKGSMTEVILPTALALSIGFALGYAIAPKNTDVIEEMRIESAQAEADHENHLDLLVTQMENLRTLNRELVRNNEMIQTELLERDAMIDSLRRMIDGLSMQLLDTD